MLLHKRIPLDITTTIGGQNCCRTLSSNWVHRGSKQLYPSPLAFPTQSWDFCCLLQVGRTEGQYCMEEVEEAKLNFSFFQSRQNATKSL